MMPEIHVEPDSIQSHLVGKPLGMSVIREKQTKCGQHHYMSLLPKMNKKEKPFEYSILLLISEQRPMMDRALLPAAVMD